jgi:hypothetical protein
MFNGSLLSDDIAPGSESLEVGLFTREQIPWQEIAFPVMRHSLELYFKFGANSGRVHHAWFSRGPDREVEIHFED